MEESEFVLYTTPTGEVKLEVLLLDESIWLTQKAIGELFGKSKSTISEHFKNIFSEGELEEIQVVRKFRTTTPHGAIKGKTQEDNFLKPYDNSIKETPRVTVKVPTASGRAFIGDYLIETKTNVLIVVSAMKSSKSCIIGFPPCGLAIRLMPWLKMQ